VPGAAASTTACVKAQKGTNEVSEADPAAEKSFRSSDPVPLSRPEFRCRAGGQSCNRETLRPQARRAYNDNVSATVRDFQPEDFDTLWRIDQECFPPGISYSRMELRFYMRRSGSFTLIANDGSASTDGRDSAGIARASVPGHLSADVARAAICGFIVAEVGRRGVGHIITIDVVAAARRCGVGSLLLRAAEDRLRARGSFAVALETAVDNVSALRFYKRHGYDVIQTLPRYYSDGMDALVLQKELVAKPLIGARRESSG
jgi:ribosomal-protein-alanine N-acetyltransferase